MFHINVKKGSVSKKWIVCRVRRVWELRLNVKGVRGEGI